MVRTDRPADRLYPRGDPNILDLIDQSLMRQAVSRLGSSSLGLDTTHVLCGHRPIAASIYLGIGASKLLAILATM
jgi:hypothetical protein